MERTPPSHDDRHSRSDSDSEASSSSFVSSTRATVDLTNQPIATSVLHETPIPSAPLSPSGLSTCSELTTSDTSDLPFPDPSLPHAETEDEPYTLSGSGMLSNPFLISAYVDEDPKASVPCEPGRQEPLHLSFKRPRKPRPARSIYGSSWVWWQ